MTLPRPSVALADQICFAFYAASRAFTARYRPMLDELGITYPQFLVLMALWEDDGQTVTELGDRLGLDSGTTSPLIKRLEKLDLVTRRRSAADERVVHVRLTDEGWALQAPGCAVSGAMIETLQLDPAEFAALKRQVEEITDRLGAGL